MAPLFCQPAIRCGPRFLNVIVVPLAFRTFFGFRVYFRVLPLCFLRPPSIRLRPDQRFHASLSRSMSRTLLLWFAVCRVYLVLVWLSSFVSLEFFFKSWRPSSLAFAFVFIAAFSPLEDRSFFHRHNVFLPRVRRWSWILITKCGVNISPLLSFAFNSRISNPLKPGYYCCNPLIFLW